MYQVCPLLQANLNAASLPASILSTNGKLVSVRPLSWGNYHDALALVSEHFVEQSGQQSIVPLTHIICSDLVRPVYVNLSHRSLVAGLFSGTSGATSSFALASYIASS